VQSITKSLNGIGYSGIGYKTTGVRALPIAKKGSTDYVEANADTAVAGKYPLARFLYVYVNKHPNKPLSPLEGEFIKLVLSTQGQMVVVKDGYIPLPSSVAEKTLKNLGL
jgi:phosphate transport system substrate-binding protein